MANILGRNDRRRRVLNEEALSASTAHLAIRRADDEDSTSADAPRYSEWAGVEHHARVSDFVPRHLGMLSALAGLGVAATGVVEALHWYVDPVTVEASGWALGPIALRVVGGLESWSMAVVMLAAAATCLMIYSLRRHRIDDFRGRYRVWRSAAIACVVVSVDCVAPVHSLVAAAGAHYTGWSALRADSAWWMLVAGVPLAWIAVRAWLDARDSRLAAVAIAGAYALFGASMGVFLTAWPADDVHLERIITSATAMLGAWTLLVGLAAYGRYVILDAQGLIAARAVRSKPVSKRTKERKEHKNESPPQPVTVRAEQVAAAPATTLKAFRQSMRDSENSSSVKAESSRWVDGRRPVNEDYDDEVSDSDDHKLSKSDRKKLRKLKAQNRAA